MFLALTRFKERRSVDMKRNLTLLGSAIAIFCMICVYTTAFAASGGVFNLNDIPEIKSKRTLNTIVETGQVWDKIIPYIDAFTKKTGVKVTVERVASPVVYSKENVEFMGGTGYYDVVYVETAWTVEWSNYLHKLEELAKKYDPSGVEGFRKDIAHHSPSIIICGQAYGDQMVLPFYTYHMSTGCFR
jgi:ABC-type glycerol-3-phosphate transport system substrate-binding protein